MKQATRLRFTERARIQRVTATGMRWSPGRRTPVHRVTPLPPETVAGGVAGRSGTPVPRDTDVAGRTHPVGSTSRGGRDLAWLDRTNRALPPPSGRRDNLEREIMQRADVRAFRTGVSSFASFFLTLVLAIGALGTQPGPACAQVTWVNAEDGEILNVSSAEGPPSDRPFVQGRVSTETSVERGTMTFNRLRLLYGVTPRVTVGIAAVHLEQQLGTLHKEGLGDTNLSLKLHFAPWASRPIRFGLRQTLSLPTGYDQELDGLAPFTSGQNDYTVQLLGQYVTPRFAAYVNPGAVLPGGSADSYLSGGLGLAFLLPLKFDFRGEYFTRWDMVTHEFESEAFLGVRHRLLLGLGVQAGVKQRLQQNETVDPEFQLGLTLGRDRAETAQHYAFRERADTGLLVHPVQMGIPDPFGIGREFAASFRAEPVGGRTQPVVYVSAVNETAPATGGLVLPRASEYVTTLSTPRTYELNINILEMRDAEIGGLDLSPLAQMPRARTMVVGQCELIAPDGYSVLTRKLFQGSASKLLAVRLAPESGSFASAQAPDELRNRLRREAVRDLMRQVRDDAIHTIQMRDYQ